MNLEFKKILKFEEKLLKMYKPKLIGIGIIAMPNLLKLTNFISFPWLCEKNSMKTHYKDLSKILISGGGSGKINNQIDKILPTFKKINGVLYVDTIIYDNYGNFSFFEKFDYQESSFLEIKYVIGRPGIGLILDCLKYSIPLLMIFEKGNEEMIHNSKIISGLGLGIEINSIIDKSDELIDLLNDKKRYNILKKSFKKQVVGGNKLIAEYILNLN
tara:strand:- start:4367 stop:5011 length:645 start_codon:yes stop_codon:yes gene_type:complete